MSKKRTLKSKITVSLFAVVILSAIVTGLLSNVFLNRKFIEYVTAHQQDKTAELVNSLGRQYHHDLDTWDVDFIHDIGMYAVYDGYIIRVTDLSGTVIWDAQSHDMSACSQIMMEIQNRMQQHYPSVDGTITIENYPLLQNGQPVGSLEIQFFGPFFLSEEDFQFLSSMNLILLTATAAALLTSLLAGSYLASRISRPVSKASEASFKMAEGDYGVRIGASTGTSEIDQMAENIDNLAQTLQHQQKLRRQLTADVAHELRTPLTSVGTHLEAMMMGVWEADSRRLKSCHDEIIRIGKIVADLESLASVESTAFELSKEPVYLNKLISDILDSLVWEIDQKQIQIKRDIPDEINLLADSGRLHQAIYNLIENAVKYSDLNGAVIIKAEVEGEWIRIFIEDDGKGISAEDIPFIFERFFRTDKSRSRLSGGSGIGLAIVKTVIEAHGGCVDVKSQLGAGSTFTVKLPRQ